MGITSGREGYVNENVRTNTGPSYDMITRRQHGPRSKQQWVEANAAARLAAQPRAGPYSQLSSPVVTTVNPYELTQNPLDPFQDNIYYILSAYRGRNTNFDLRGQPNFPRDFLQGQDQLVESNVVEKLVTHGPDIQITGCRPPRPPRY